MSERAHDGKEYKKKNVCNLVFTKVPFRILNVRFETLGLVTKREFRNNKKNDACSTIDPLKSNGCDV